MEQKKSNSVILILLFLGAKFGKILAVLKAFKFAKYAITLVSMAISSVLYGFAYGSWWFAFGIVLLLFVHEYGHVMATVRQGVKASAPIFIPFLGALIFMKEVSDRNKEAYIGFGGPLIGSLGAVVCIGIAFLVDDAKTATIFHLLGYVGLFLNLFNLIPARPLDGGRVLHVLGDKVIYVGFPMLLFFAYLISDTMLVAIALMAVYEARLVRAWVFSGLAALIGLTGTFKILIDPYPNFWMQLIALTIVVTLTFIFLTGTPFVFRKKRGDYCNSEGQKDTHPLPPTAVRIKWLLIYLISVVSLGGLMAWHSQFLPKEVKEHSITKYFSQ